MRSTIEHLEIAAELGLEAESYLAKGNTAAAVTATSRMVTAVAQAMQAIGYDVTRCPDDLDIDDDPADQRANVGAE